MVQQDLGLEHRLRSVFETDGYVYIKTGVPLWISVEQDLTRPLDNSFEIQPPCLIYAANSNNAGKGL